MVARASGGIGSNGGGDPTPLMYRLEEGASR